MRCLSSIYDGPDTTLALEHFVSRVEAEGLTPSLIIASASCTQDIAGVRSVLAEKFGCAIHGATSCRGAMTNFGHTTELGDGVGFFVLSDRNGDYGTAAEEITGSAQDASCRAAQHAIHAADRQGEVPDLVWVSVSPGHEEAVLAGIRQVVGSGVPVVGGSAADNTIEGNWAVFDRNRVIGSGVVVTVMYPSKSPADVFQNGYSPTKHSGVVTRSSGRRIHEIDGRPAAQVIAEWTGGATFSWPVGEARPILSESTFRPLGSTVQQRAGQRDFILIHPSAVNPDGSIDVFADVGVGQIVTQMHGTPDSLVARAGQVAGLTRNALRKSGEEIGGALVIFCGGCMLAVQDRIDDVIEEIATAIGDVPFLGAFTFGEQGYTQAGESVHGNLMISCVAFAK